MLVSIVIPCYNHAEFLAESIESALNQTEKCEVIVVNDGSTDNTSEIAKKYPVVLVEQKNMGLSAARNAGIRAATSEYIIPLDADDILDKHAVEKMLSEMKDGIGVVRIGFKRFGDMEDEYIFEDEVTYRSMRIANSIIATALFPKKIWEEVGGYDEDMKDGYEDWEFFLRFLKAGYNVATIKEALLSYRKHGESMIDSSNAKADKIIEYIYNKHRVPGGKILYVDTSDIALLNGVKYYRMLVPMKELEALGYQIRVNNEFAVKDADGNLSLIVDDIDWCDVLVMPRYFDSSPNIIVSLVNYAKEQGKKIVYETDDYLKEIPEHNQSAEKVNLESTQLMIDFLEKSADVKTVTTKKLAELIDAKICPNSVDMDLWGNLENKKKPGKFRIGWSGGWTHKKDLEMIVPVIKKLKEKYQFEFVIHGFDPEIQKSELYYKFYPQVRMLDYPEALANLGLDIAIAPLVDDEFNQYKSNIKWLEAAMLKVPIVASNLPPYSDIKHGFDGFLCSTNEEFYVFIEKLILDSQLRKNVGENAYLRVKNEFDIKNTIHTWEEAYSCQS